MGIKDFGILEDIDTKLAWEREASDFTPWLSENLDRLGAAIGLRLSLITTEAGLPTEDDRFSADIHAIDDLDGSTVLIENQLSYSDHTHLGQILTYLAGLKAKAIIWIAPHFRDAHLAAIRWLNENTLEGFSFFAVKLRVVRIGVSPLAPLFDVLEQPNNWQRRQASKAREDEALSEIGLSRSVFWNEFNLRYPKRANDAGGGGNPSRWIGFDPKLSLKYYLAKDHVGIYVTGQKLVTVEETAAALGARLAELAARLSAPSEPVDGKWFLLKKKFGNFNDVKEAAMLSDWLAEQAELYISELSRHYSPQ